MSSLHALLTDGIRYSPRYLPSLNSDHMPMTLCAITGLGGDLDFCIRFRNDYKKILHEIPQERPLKNWRQGIGRSEAYPSLLAWFKEQVADKGIESAVGIYLPEFIGGLALQAFHPVIRLAYAIDFQSEAETAAALAYMVSSHRDIPVNAGQLLDIAQEMQKQVKRGPRSFRTAEFTDNICELLDAGEYPAGYAAEIGDCAAIALDIYRSTRNFFALHMVTATHAVRICSKFLDERQALAALASGLLAAHRVVGSPRFERGNPLPVPDRLGREHAFKYTWACLSEYCYYGDERYIDEIRGFRENGLVPAWSAKNEV